MPTVCIYSLRVVVRKMAAKRILIRITIRMGVGTGIPGIKLPIAVMIGLETVGVAPPLIQ